MSNARAYFGDSRWVARLDKPPLVVNAGVSQHGQYGDERYLLPNLWSLHLYPYDAGLVLDIGEFPIQAGTISIVPPNVPIRYRYDRPCEHLFVHFALEATTEPRDFVVFPLMMDLGTDFSGLYQDMLEVTGDVIVSSYRLRARFWDVLCRLTARFRDEGDAGETTQPHPLVRRARTLIEQRLGGPITVDGLADELGVSPGYLVRRFREHDGTTVVGYLRRRRLERAAHLLGNTTMTIKAIAAATGMADLHSFNKAIHRGFGRSPREMRARAEAEASFAEPTPRFWTDQRTSAD